MDKTDPRWRNCETIPWCYISMEGVSGGHRKNRKKSDREKSSGGRERTEDCVNRKWKWSEEKIKKKEKDGREKGSKNRNCTGRDHGVEITESSSGCQEVLALVALAADCSWLMPQAGASLQSHAWWPEDRKQGGTVSALVATGVGGTGALQVSLIWHTE